MHDIVPTQADIKSIYDLTNDQLKKVIEVGGDAIEAGLADSLVLYFDDSYVSLIERVLSVERPVFSSFNAAVITNTIDTPGHMSARDITSCVKAGVTISSHGVSHAALAIFDKHDSLLPTLPGGGYEDTPYGKKRQLRENEVRFQLHESKQRLEEVSGQPVDELVLPYGLYNICTLKLVAASTDYSFVTSCHSAIDVGQTPRPRHLITQQNIDRLTIDVSALTETYTPLY